MHKYFKISSKNKFMKICLSLQKKKPSQVKMIIKNSNKNLTNVKM
jgi:hypothetical protein